jgi:hypothetical protein
VFVLAVDKAQLGECVKSLYGTGLNADGYLRRFIDLEYRLPTPEKGRFVDALFEKYGLNEVFATKVGDTQFDRQNLGEILKELFPVFDFSLRIQEQCFTQISLVMRTTPPNAYLYGTMLGLLICLRVANRQLYLDYVRGFASASVVLTYLRSLPGGDELVDSREGIFIEAELVFGMSDRSSGEEAIKQYEALAKSADKDKALRERATTVLQYIGQLGFRSMLGGNLTNYLFSKIEVTRRFLPVDPKS